MELSIEFKQRLFQFLHEKSGEIPEQMEEKINKLAYLFLLELQSSPFYGEFLAKNGDLNDDEIDGLVGPTKIDKLGDLVEELEDITSNNEIEHMIHVNRQLDAKLTRFIANQKKLIENNIILISGGIAPETHDSPVHSEPSSSSSLHQSSLQSSESSTSIQLSKTRTPMYRMSRTLRTFPELHREWYYGLDGHLSIRELNNKHQAKWRRNNSNEKNFYSLRLKIIKYFEKLKEHNNIGDYEAIEQIESFRMSKKLTLDGLSRYIREHRLLE